jgi:cytochrome c peroxidase
MKPHRKTLAPRAISNPIRTLALVMCLNLAVAPVYAVLPMKTIGVPDVNELGLLDGSGTGYLDADWGSPITKPGQKQLLQKMGKAAFYDMQMGGDGITSCASCHYNAGADNRNINQMSPGLRRTEGGANDLRFDKDFTHQLVGPNGALNQDHYGGAGTEIGLPVSEAAVQAASGGPNTDDPLTGAPAALGDPVTDGSDVNDVVSSQGPRAMSFDGLHCQKPDASIPAVLVDIACDDPLAESFPTDPAGNGLSPGRQDMGLLETPDPGFDSNEFAGFTAPSAGIPDTVRHVEPRNAQTTYNAIFNQRSFWDGRADIFFNGVNTLGFRDPDAMVKVYSEGSITEERMNVPFSSLASQVMGPIESVMEMVGHVADGRGRPNHFLGKKMVDATPLFNQLIDCNDSLLGDLLAGCSSPGVRGLAGDYNSYRGFITDIFAQRFWGDGTFDGTGDSKDADICLAAPDFNTVVDPTDCGIGSENRTLIELNFAMFSALAIQAYEATLVTKGSSIVELLSGGVIPSGTTITNTLRNRTVTVDLGLPFPGNGARPNGLANVGLTLEECIQLVALNNGPAQNDIATNLCTLKFAEFIPAGAFAGSQANAAPNPVAANTSISGCDGTLGNPTCTAAVNTLLNVDEGLGRFQAGATACSVCHFSPTFTGATVAATTGFGAPPPEPFIPPGQLAREEAPAFIERMGKFDGGNAVYDAGFYNIGVRPTAEDLSLGGRVGGVPLAFTKLKELLLNPTAVPAPFDRAKIIGISDSLDGVTGPGKLQLPTSMMVNELGVKNLAPVPFQLTLACGPGLVGNGNANNNPNQNCVPDIIQGEFLLRNGAFKSPGLHNVKYTAPYLHNGSKMNLQQLWAFYRTIGALAPATTNGFPNMNLANMDAGLRVVGLSPEREAAVIEMMETGLTDWDAAHERGKFDHPELCVPLGHDPVTGLTNLVSIPAVGAGGNAVPLATFEDVLEGGSNHAHDLTIPCSMPGVLQTDGVGIDVPPAA